MGSEGGSGSASPPGPGVGHEPVAVQDDKRSEQDDAEYCARDLRVLHPEQHHHDDESASRYLLLSSPSVLVNTFPSDLYQHHDMHSYPGTEPGTPTSPQLKELQRLRPTSADQAASDHQQHFSDDLVSTGMRQLPGLFPHLAAPAKLHDDYLTTYAPLALDALHHNGTHAHLDDVLAASLKSEKHCEPHEHCEQASVVVENSQHQRYGQQHSVHEHGVHEHGVHNGDHVEYLPALSRESSPQGSQEDQQYDQLTTLQPGQAPSPDDPTMYTSHGVAHALQALPSWSVAALQQADESTHLSR